MQRWLPLQIALQGQDLYLVSVYGYTSGAVGPHNRALVEEIAQWVVVRGYVHGFLAGDWNMAPYEFRKVAPVAMGSIIGDGSPT